MNFIRNRKIKDGPQTSFEGFICPQNSDRQQKIRVFGRSPAGEGQVGQKHLFGKGGTGRIEKAALQGGYIPCPFGKGEGLGVG